MSKDVAQTNLSLIKTNIEKNSFLSIQNDVISENDTGDMSKKSIKKIFLIHIKNNKPYDYYA
jgi:hypothetical protein